MGRFLPLRFAQGWPVLLLGLLLGGALLEVAIRAVRFDRREADLPALAWQPANAGLLPAQPVVALAADPTDRSLLLVATAAPPQLYHSADRGVTWQAVGQALGGRQVHRLLAVPGARGVFLAGTSDGLLRSSDGGLTWQAVAAVPRPPTPPQGLRRSGRNVYALTAGGDGALYLAGEDDRLWRSLDAGATWEPLAALPLSSLAALLAVAVSPDGGRLLAGSAGDGLFRSDDSGQTWQPAEDIPPTFVAGLWFDPADGRIVYARAQTGLYRSADGGMRWQPVDAALDGRADAFLPGPSAGEALLLTNAGRVYATADGGRTWQPRGALDRPGTAYGLWSLADAHGLTLVAATHAGLWRGDETAERWQPWPAGPGHPVANDLALAADGSLYLATPAGVYRSDDNAAIWARRSDGLPAAAVLSVAAAPSAPHVLYAGTDGRGLYRSDDAGSTWTATALEVPSVPGIVVDPADPSHLIVRAAFQRVYESHDGGDTWRTPWDGLDLSTEIISLSLGTGEPLALYAGGTEQLFRTADPGQGWQPIAPELAGQTVFQVLPDPADPGRLYVGASKGLYLSRDGGAGWMPAGRGLEGVTVVALARHPTQPAQVFVGTRYRGLYRTLDGGATWQPAGLKGLSVHRLVVSADGRWLIAATDHELWRAALTGGAP